MPGDWHVRFLRGPGVARRRAYLANAIADGVALTHYELRDLRNGSEGVLLLQVRGVWKGKPMDRGPMGDEAGLS